MGSINCQIAVLPGDGIGAEVMAARLQVLSAVQLRIGRHFACTEHPAGAQHDVDTGVALPEPRLAACRAADAILFGAMGLPHVRGADGTESIPQLDIRFALDRTGLRLRAAPGPAAPGRRPPRPGGPCRQGKGVCVDGLLAQGVRRACGGLPRPAHRACLRRCDGPEPGAQALAQRAGDPALADGVRAIEAALQVAFESGAVRPREFGGSSGTADIVHAVLARL